MINRLTEYMFNIDDFLFFFLSLKNFWKSGDYHAEHLMHFIKTNVENQC